MQKLISTIDLIVEDKFVLVQDLFTLEKAYIEAYSPL